MARTFGKMIFTTSLLYFFITAMGQTRIPYTSSYQTGLLKSDLFSTDKAVFYTQPALLCNLESPIISANIQSLYTGFNLNAYALHIGSSLPGNFGGGVSIVRLGHPDYNASNIVVGFARRLTPHTSIGIGQRFQTINIVNESRPWSGSSVISSTYDHTTWGVSINLSGILQWQKNQYKDVLSLQAASYIYLKPNTQLYFSLEHYQHTIQPCTGFRHKILKNVEIFGAFQWYPARYGTGMVVPLGDYLVSIVSTTYHPVLGWSPTLGLQWNGKRKEKINKKQELDKE